MTDSLSEIIYLNVGGTKFATSKQTLTSIEDTFFTSLISDHRFVTSLKDSSDAFFIDRDPNLFKVILNYLRTRQLVNADQFSMDVLLHEAQFYGITPLVKRLQACQNFIKKEICGGNVLFQGIIKNKNAGRNGDQRVRKIIAHHNALCIAFKYQVCCYRLKDSLGWQLMFEAENEEQEINDIAFSYNCRFFNYFGQSYNGKVLIGLCYQERKKIRLWSFSPIIENLVQTNRFSKEEIGCFDLNDCSINYIFFIGYQLVALAYKEGRVGVYHSASQNWLVQDLTENKAHSITAFDKSDDFLLLASKLGSIYLIDMQKFPLRMKDNDLLINEIYQDPESEEISTISSYLTRNFKQYSNWLEIAYGTREGTVRVLLQQPETVGHGPQLYQTYKVHLNPIVNVMLSEKYLISICNKMHVRTWAFTRFRGHISTHPGSTSLASFKILALDESELGEVNSKKAENDKSEDWLLYQYNVGPFGQQDDGDKQVLIEKLQTHTDNINVLNASNGTRICTLTSADGSLITTYFVQVCETILTSNSSKLYIFTGHKNGNVQIWDLSTVVDHTSNQPSTPDIDYEQFLQDF